MPSEASRSRRARLQLSCQPCRIGKLKCNRELPCEQCTKRSRETHCVYTTGAQESINYKAQARAMKEKLENLERAVQHFKNTEQTQSGSTDVSRGFAGMQLDQVDENSSPGETPASTVTGGMMMTRNGVAYVASTHWASVMADIEDVKAYFDNDDDHETTETTPSETSAKVSSPEAASPPDLYLRTTSMTKDALIASVPHKPVADRLLAAYFGSMDLYKPSVHVPTFQKQYQQFWQYPTAMPTSWIALLFAILALGFQYTIQVDPSREKIHEKNMYLELAGDAIVVADYTVTKPYTIESLLLYLRGCLMQGPERQVKDWLTMGLLCKLSLRMGYHRDPSMYPGMSPFDQEMRRRIWMFVTFMDVTQSYQVGLPSIATGLESRVLLPRNLFDSDFGPDSKELPPSRPPREWTTIGHSLHKGRLLPLFGEAIRMSHAPVPPNLDQLYDVAARLQKVQDEIPPPLILVPPDQALGDSPDLLIKRFGMETLAQKTRCVLFRRYLGSGEVKARKACVWAALRLLKVQRLLEEARLPGGPLSHSASQYFWDLMDSFLLATIIVGLELKAIERDNATRGSSVFSQEEHRIMKAAVQTSCDMWERCTIASDKAKRAARALAKGLRSKLKEENDEIQQLTPVSPTSNTGAQPAPRMSPEMAWPTSTNINGEEFDFNNFDMGEAQQAFMNSANMGQLPDAPMTIDWGAFDSQLNALDAHEDFLLAPNIFEGGLTPFPGPGS